MLSEREQRALQEVERQLLAEDPDFARSFDEVGQRDSAFSLQAMPRWLYPTAIAGTAAAGFLMLAVGADPITLVLAMLATMILVVRRRRGASGRAGT
jgi:hypothetical protein